MPFNPLKHVQRMVETVREYRRAAPWSARPQRPSFEKDADDCKIRIAKGEMMKLLAESPGYKMLMADIAARRQELSDSVKTIKHKDLNRLQADLEATDFLLAIVPRAIQDGMDAKQRMNDIAQWLQEQIEEGADDATGE